MKRRDMLKTGAVAIGAAFLPRTAGAATTLAGRGRSELLEAASVEYLAELARFAEPLRSRFESGELRADRPGEGDDGESTPFDEVKRLCQEHFGLQVTTTTDHLGNEWYDGDYGTAYLLLAASPRGEATEPRDYSHPCGQALEAVSWDLIALARRRGWYTPTHDEFEDPAIETWCEQCGHVMSNHGDGLHDKAGCPVVDCNCGVRHAPHVKGPAQA